LRISVRLEVERGVKEEIRRIHATMRTMAAEIAGLRRTMLDAGLDPPPPSLDDYISVTEYAELHHISKVAVYARIRRKTIDAKKVPGIGLMVKNV
jgi:hypothetical protein